MDPTDIRKNRAKKDALWKPLLRGFRNFYKDELIHALDLHKFKKFIKRAKLAEMEEACRDFLEKSQAPRHIVENPLHWHALIVLAVPVSSKKLSSALVDIPVVQTNLPQLAPIFSGIFRENSKTSRTLFFQNELV